MSRSSSGPEQQLQQHEQQQQQESQVQESQEQVDAEKRPLDNAKLQQEQTTETQGAELRVVSVNLQEKDNRKSHHTDEYEHQKLIVRRGQGVKVTVTFNRPLDRKQDKVTLQLTFGDKPKVSKGTLLRLTLRDDALTNSGWYAQYVGQKENEVEMIIMPASRAIVGEYSLYVETMVMKDGEHCLNRKQHPGTLVVLFNPWCKEDDVYMEEAREREEYVLNERGRLWGGTRSSYGGFPWNFGQFEDVSLDAALYLLELGRLTPRARTNPVQVMRAMAALGNSSDEAGVLTGRWEKPYPAGTTHPSAWTGSVAILEQYMKTKKPVEFGQCWVFSGILTTLLRALGIATRSVTNFDSAHDCDASNTIDVHVNKNDEPLPAYDDSVWTFHVWNESWCKRHDLPEGHDGWQAHDATPQEASGGIYRCGPASIRAIKEGMVYLPYDTAFIFSEVNADRIYWKENADGEFEVDFMDKRSIGFDISTKSVGNYRRLDLTAHYKHPEGSIEERASVKRACRHSGAVDWGVYEEPEQLVSFELVVPESVPLGDDFDVSVQLQSVSEAEQQVKGRITVVLARYTGVVSNRILSHPFTTSLTPRKEMEVSVHVGIGDYQHLLEQEAVIKVYLRAQVLGSKQAYARQQSFYLTKPGIRISAPDSVDIGEKFTLSMSFTNPLQEPLSGGYFCIEAPGITKSTYVVLSEAVAAGAQVGKEVVLTATRSGHKEIVVRFTSYQIAGMSGTHAIYIKYPEQIDQLITSEK